MFTLWSRTYNGSLLPAIANPSVAIKDTANCFSPASSLRPYALTLCFDHVCVSPSPPLDKSSWCDLSSLAGPSWLFPKESYVRMAPSLAFHHPPGSGWWASPSQKLCTECWGLLGLCSLCVFQAGCCSRPLGRWSMWGSPFSWSVTVGRKLLYKRFNFSRMAEASSFLIRILTSTFQKQNLNTVAPTSAGGLSGVKTSLQRLWTSLFKVRDVQSASKGPSTPCVGTLPSHWEDELGGDCWPSHRRLYKGHSLCNVTAGAEVTFPPP